MAVCISPYFINCPSPLHKELSIEQKICKAVASPLASLQPLKASGGKGLLFRTTVRVDEKSESILLKKLDPVEKENYSIIKSDKLDFVQFSD
jgi:hypothetical protein